MLAGALTQPQQQRATTQPPSCLLAVAAGSHIAGYESARLEAQSEESSAQIVRQVLLHLGPG